MAKKTKSKPLGTAGMVAIGAVVGLVVAVQWRAGLALAEQDAYESLPRLGAAAGAVLTYLVLCWKRPWIPCWRKKCGTPNKEPGRRRAPFGVRRDCWLCGGRKKWLRPGARVLAVFGFRPRGSD